ncbi:MAG: hypothetical protein U5K00_09075 [Melioribacteraceae bacterium]|nr:hypothetical protein [Melioribacteraceae bacterium]
MKSWSIDADSKGNLHFGTSGGVSIKRGNEFVNLSLQDGLPAEKVYSVAVDKHDRVFAGTVKGLAIIENEKVVDVITKENGLSQMKFGDWVWIITKHFISAQVQPVSIFTIIIK